MPKTPVQKQGHMHWTALYMDKGSSTVVIPIVYFGETILAQSAPLCGTMFAINASGNTQFPWGCRLEFHTCLHSILRKPRRSYFTCTQTCQTFDPDEHLSEEYNGQGIAFSNYGAAANGNDAVAVWHVSQLTQSFNKFQSGTKPKR